LRHEDKGEILEFEARDCDGPHDADENHTKQPYPGSIRRLAALHASIHGLISWSLEPNSSTSSASQTSTAPTGSASSGGTRTFGELLIALEEDKEARAVVFGLLAEMERE